MNFLLIAENMWLIWLILFAFFAIIEAFTINLISVWLAAGALVAFLANRLGLGLWAQVSLFFFSASLAIIFLRTLIRRFLASKKVATNVESLPGREAVVIQSIEPPQTGQVKIDGQIWTARGEKNSVFKIGEVALVERVEGVTALLSKKTQ